MSGTTGVLPRGGRLLASWTSQGGRRDLAAHLATHGPSPATVRGRPAAGRWWEEVERSGLTGRGGGGFPAGRKLAATRQERGRRVLVVNATEGEPASRKDWTLVTTAPHLVLDGAVIAAEIVGAVEIVCCVGEDRPEMQAALVGALAERAGLDGRRVRWTHHAVPARYIQGEESALVDWLAGGRGLPQFRATKAVRPTIGRAPALVHNAETLAHIALIARHGGDWFREVGTARSPGSTLVTLSGALDRPGVLEVALGTPVASIVDAGHPRGQVGAVLVGGYGGSWVGADVLGVPFARAELERVGASCGAGVLGVLARDSCGLAETARIVAYMAGESAGQCGPCQFGLPALAEDLAQVAWGAVDRRTLERIRHRAGLIEGRGACRHPDGVVRLVRSALEVFASDLGHHARSGPCRAARAPALLPVPGVRGTTATQPSGIGHLAAPPPRGSSGELLGSSRR